MTAHKKWVLADEELAEPEGQDEQDGGNKVSVPGPGDGRHHVRLQRLALPDHESGGRIMG